MEKNDKQQKKNTKKEIEKKVKPKAEKKARVAPETEEENNIAPLSNGDDWDRIPAPTPDNLAGELEEEEEEEEESEEGGKSNILKDTKKHTHTESSIQWYLEEINKIPLLTRSEEDRLSRAANAGDEKAKERLIVANLRFVVQVAKKYQKYGISLLDLINEGNMGLIKAAERFDPDMGFHFISYAVWWIRQAIILAINQKASIIRLPMNRTIDLNRIEKIQKELENEYGEEPTIAMIAERLDIPVEEVKWLKQISSDYISLDAPLGNDSENTQMSTMEDDKYESPENEVMNNALHDAINNILKELTLSEREIIEFRFGLNGKPRLSLTQAGKKFHLSKERVRQIEKKTLLKLQKYGHKKELEAFLPGR
jgi:RNA polymerase primary sigma factor